MRIVVTGLSVCSWNISTFKHKISCILLNMYKSQVFILSKYNFNNISARSYWVDLCLAAYQHCRGIFTYTCSCSSCVCVCVCVCVCGMVMVCGKKTWMHLQEHVNTFVQVTFWPWTHNGYDTLIRLMQQNATIYEE